MNQSNESDQTSHEMKNGSKMIFYKLIYEIVFETFHVSDAFVASVAFVAFIQQHQLTDVAISLTPKISASISVILVTSVSKVSVQTLYQNENESELISSNDLVSASIISSSESNEPRHIISSNDVALATVISADRPKRISSNASDRTSYQNENGSEITSLNDLASAMIISIFNFIAADLLSSTDTPSPYESNHSHSYASSRFLPSYTAHQTLIESEKYSILFLVVNWPEKNKINSIKSTFDQLRRLLCLHHDFYIRRSLNAFRISSFFFSFRTSINR